MFLRNTNLTWTTRDGKTTRIVDMETEHLANTINYLARKTQDWAYEPPKLRAKYQAMIEELTKRKLMSQEATIQSLAEKAKRTDAVELIKQLRAEKRPMAFDLPSPIDAPMYPFIPPRPFMHPRKVRRTTFNDVFTGKTREEVDDLFEMRWPIPPSWGPRVTNIGETEKPKPATVITEPKKRKLKL